MPRLAVVRGEGVRVPILSRVTREVRGQLEQSAGQSGRSLAGEIEHRLMRSYQDETIEAVVERAVGRIVAPVVKIAVREAIEEAKGALVYTTASVHPGKAFVTPAPNQTAGGAEPAPKRRKTARRKRVAGSGGP